jgi:hypothetical protein
MAPLGAAERAYRSALRVRGRADAPAAWATIQANLAGVLSTVGRAAGDAAVLREAVAAYRSALSVFTPGGTPQPWTELQIGLGDCLTEIASKDGGSPPLESVAEAYRAVLAVATCGHAAWSRSRFGLGRALHGLARTNPAYTDALDAAEAALRGVLVDWTMKRDPQWVLASRMLGEVLILRGRARRDVADIAAEEIAERAGSKAQNRHQAASRWKGEGKIFSVPWQGLERFPAFQFDHGRPIPAVASALAALPDRMSRWEVAFWFVSTNGWLAGKSPQDALRDNPWTTKSSVPFNGGGNGWLGRMTRSSWMVTSSQADQDRCAAASTQ